MFSVDELAPGPNGPRGLLRMHWASKKRIRDRWTTLIREQRPAKWKPVKGHVIVTRHSSREMDKDNLYASCKFVLDALVRAGVIADDSPEHITLDARWQKGKSHTTIEVISAPTLPEAFLAARRAQMGGKG